MELKQPCNLTGMLKTDSTLSCTIYLTKHHLPGARQAIITEEEIIKQCTTLEDKPIKSL